MELDCQWLLNLIASKKFPPLVRSILVILKLTNEKAYHTINDIKSVLSCALLFDF